jgi:hypothetical protein
MTGSESNVCGLPNASNGAFNSPNCEDFSHCAHCSAFNVAHSVGAQWRVVAARSATGMGTLNPKPRDLDKAAVIMNGDEMRLRRADEQTEAGHEVERLLFIECCNIGVRTMTKYQRLTLGLLFDNASRASAGLATVGRERALAHEELVQVLDQHMLGTTTLEAPMPCGRKHFRGATTR